MTNEKKGPTTKTSRCDEKRKKKRSQSQEKSSLVKLIGMGFRKSW